jgi:3-deoxy-7-phosphoheptulonate synthase
MKNPTSGNLKIAINSIISAQSEHVFSLHGRQIKTSGNPYAHLILRGGNGQPNFHQKELQEATKLLTDNKIKNPTIVVDVSHENCINPETGKKDANLQPQIIQDILASMEQDKNIKQTIKGFMVESFLQAGNQNLNNFTKSEDLENGKSVTDPCLDWEKTEQMIYDLAEKI